MYGSYADFGLEEISEVDFSDGCYQYDLLGVWWHPETESYRVSRSSGCSCTSPWDEHYKLDDYGPPLSYSEAWSEIQETGSYGDVSVEKAEAITALRDFEAKRNG